MRAKSRGAGRRDWRRELETGKPLISARRGARSIMGAIKSRGNTKLRWTERAGGWLRRPGLWNFQTKRRMNSRPATRQACQRLDLRCLAWRADRRRRSPPFARRAAMGAADAGQHGGDMAVLRVEWLAQLPIMPGLSLLTAAAPARRRSSRLSDPPHRRRRRDKARRSMDPAASRENSGGGRNPWPFPKSVKMGRNRSRNDRKRGAFVVDLSCPRLLRRRHASSLCHATSGPARSMRPSEW